MKKITLFFSAAILLVSLATTSSFVAPPPGPSTNGQGTFAVGDNTRHFSFHASMKPNGDVKGSGVLTYIGGVQKIMFDITCMMVSGNRAYMSGVVTKWPSAPENEGLPCYFAVEDNGEGANATPDQMTLLYFADVPCVDQQVPMIPITGGNVQVKN